jgi:serine phosphatase RsbU (regulator of sigma subunit)
VTDTRNPLPATRPTDPQAQLERERFAMRSLLEFARTLTPDLGIEGIIRSVERTVMGKGLISDCYSYLADDEAGSFRFINRIGFRKLELPPVISFEEFERWAVKPREGVAFVMPILDSDQQEIIAFIGFGKSLSPTIDIEDEPNYLESLSLLTGIALTNAKLFASEKERERLSAQIEIAREIQQDLLPEKLPDVFGAKFFAYSKQSELVGGDYYDVIRIDEHRVLIAIADVVGKGIGAAILMSNLQASLHSLINGLERERINLLRATRIMNNLIYDSTTPERYITAAFAMVDLEARRIESVVCGHPKPLVISGGKVHTLPTSGVPLGIIPKFEYTLHEESFERGTRLVFYTDGLSEACTKTNTSMLGDKGVETFFTSHSFHTSAELTTALGTSSDLAINDDITVVVADV